MLWYPQKSLSKAVPLSVFMQLSAEWAAGAERIFSMWDVTHSVANVLKTWLCNMALAVF